MTSATATLDSKNLELFWGILGSSFKNFLKFRWLSMCLKRLISIKNEQDGSE